MTKIIAVLLFLFPATTVFAQSTAVETLGITTANQAANGLGFNMDNNQGWEFQSIAGMGGKYARFQCNWAGVENQKSITTAGENVTAGYTPDPNCAAGFAYAKQYGIHPTVVAGYGGPYQPILGVSVASNVAIGSTSIPIVFVEQVQNNVDTLANIIPVTDLIGPAFLSSSGALSQNTSSMTIRGSYGGSLVTGYTPTSSTTGTISLGSATSMQLLAPVTLTGCSIMNSNNLPLTLTCTSGGFVAGMEKITTLQIPGAGQGGATLTGALLSVTSPTTATLEAGIYDSVTNQTVVATPMYLISQQLYIPAATLTAADPSVIAYANYVDALAAFMSASGATGDIELWNEPTWAPDPWDNQCGYYDTEYCPGETTYNGYQPNFGFAALLMNGDEVGYVNITAGGTYSGTAPTVTFSAPSSGTTAVGSAVLNGAGTAVVGVQITNRGSGYNTSPTVTFSSGGATGTAQVGLPPGVTITWGGTNLTGGATLLTGTSGRMYQYARATLVEPSTVITRETVHPYGYEPEQDNGLQACLQSIANGVANPTLNTPAPNVGSCYPTGEPTVSNFTQIMEDTLVAQRINPAYGLSHGITETGIFGYQTGMGLWTARFDLRQYLAYQADGVTPIEFYRFCAPPNAGQNSDQTFSFVNTTTCTVAPNPVVPSAEMTALTGLMSTLALISNTPVTSYSAATLPSVTSYTGGTFPLTSTHMVGARTGATANSDLFSVWQRSYVPLFTGSISGTVLTVSSMINTGAPLAVGQLIGTAYPGPMITSFGTGTGGAGTYNLSTSSTVPSGSLNGTWVGQPQPAAATATVTIPADVQVTSVTNGTTTAAVSYTVNGSTSNGYTITFPVSDDPVEILCDPAFGSSTSVSTNLSTTTYGQQVTLKATVTPVGTSITPTGWVTFSVGSTTLGSSSVVNGVATLTTTSLPGSSGTAEIVTGAFQSTSFAPSSGTVSETINPAATTTSVAATSAAANFGQSITLSATVAATGISYVPNGSVTFTSGSINLGNATLNGSGVASVITGSLPAGNAPVTASYAASADFSASSGTANVPVQSGISGTVYGGQSPVSGATIQLYQAGVGSGSSYQANASELLGYSVTTGSNGTFSISGEYTCTPGTYVYVTASGGNAGAGNNANLALMASIGPCSNLSTSMTINEVTTVAAAYAFAQFAAGSYFGTPLTSQPGSTSGTSAPAIDIATSSTNMMGLANAAAIAQLLASTPTGTSPGSNGTGALNNPLTVPITGGGSTGAIAEFWQVNTIANILAACVNTTGGMAGSSSNCGTLFSNVTVPVGINPATNAAYVAPADTIQAAVYLALNPGLPTANIAALAPLAAQFAPFTPYVSSASNINDFTVAIQFLPVVPGTETSVVAQGSSITIDSNGNAWILNQLTNGTYATSVVELSPTGVPMQAGSSSGNALSNYQITTYDIGSTPTTVGGQYIYNNSAGNYQSIGYLDPALDTNNNLWLNDRRNDSVLEITGSGATGAGNTHNGGNAGDAGGHGAVGYQLPIGSAPDLVKLDASNNLWIYLNGTVTAGVEGTGTSSTTCGTSYSGYTTGLVGFLGESPSNVVYGGPITPAASTGDQFAAIDPLASKDVTTGGTIPGSPFLWTTQQSYIYQNYTTANGLSQSGSTVPAGCYTPLQTIGSVGYASGAVTLLPGKANTPVSGDTTYGTGQLTYDIGFDAGGSMWISKTGAIDSESTIKSAFIKVSPAYGSSFSVAQAEANFTFNYYHGVAGLNDSGTPNPRFFTIDGSGNVWFDFSTANGIGEISNLGLGLSPAGATPGFFGSTCVNCSYIGEHAQTYARDVAESRRPAIDLSGNVWIPQTGTGAKGILMLVGAAVPTGSPISLALKNHTVATRP